MCVCVLSVFFFHHFLYSWNGLCYFMQMFFFVFLYIILFWMLEFFPNKFILSIESQMTRNTPIKWATNTLNGVNEAYKICKVRECHFLNHINSILITIQQYVWRNVIDALIMHFWFDFFFFFAFFYGKINFGIMYKIKNYYMKMHENWFEFNIMWFFIANRVTCNKTAVWQMISHEPWTLNWSTK